MLRIERAYEIRGMLEKTTSYDATTSGNVVNEVKLVYNDFGQLVTEYHASRTDANDHPTTYVYEILPNRT